MGERIPGSVTRKNQSDGASCELAVRVGHGAGAEFIQRENVGTGGCHCAVPQTDEGSRGDNGQCDESECCVVPLVREAA
jgi:hypothetical protein